MSDYHVPVMLDECLKGLNIEPGGTYVDATFGGGGHSRAILEKIKDGKLIVFDQDPDARKEAEMIKERSFTFCQANFKYLKKYLKLNGISKVHGSWPTLEFHRTRLILPSVDSQPGWMGHWTCAWTKKIR